MAAIFLVNVPICLAGVLVARRVLPEDQTRHGYRIDLLGVAALSGALLLLVIPLILGQGAGWPAWAIICHVVSVPASAGFVWTQQRALRRGGRPLVNVRVIRRPPVLLALLAVLLATGACYALLFCLAQYFQRGLGRSMLASGLILVPWVVAFGVAGQLTRRLPPRYAPSVPAAGYGLLALAYAGLCAASAGHGADDVVLIALLAVGGLVLGTGFATFVAHLTNAVPETYAPDISGVSATTLQIGGALGVAVFGTVYVAALGGPVMRLR